jgi:hypothetical protein
MKHLLTLLAGAALAAPCLAGPPKGYDEATTAYKADTKIEDPTLVNAGFLGNIAVSQATRKSNNLSAAADAGDEEPRGVLPREDEGLRFASPTVYGTIRGDLTVVVQRGAVRGSITSVRR